MTDLKFAVTYARVSTKDQERTGHTLPVQSKNMQAFAQGRGLKVVREFVVAESASKRDRRHYGELWNFLGQHPEVKHLIFEEIDRFTRNDKDKVALLDRVNEEGYVAHFVLEKLTLDKETSPNDIFLFDILVAKAKNYSAALSQKVKKGQLGKLEKGGYPGGYPPLGYRKVNGELVPDEPYASCVRKAFELADEQHLPTRPLARQLSELGFRTQTGRKITKSKVHALLINPIYSGVIHWKEQMFNGSHPAVVDKARFRRVQDWLNRRPCSHWITHNFTYRSSMRCGECGSGITAEIHKGFIYYHCTHYHECSQQRYTREEVIEEQFIPLLNDLHLGEETATLVKAKILAKREDENGFRRLRQEDLQKQYAQILGWADRLYDDRMAGVVDEEMYRRKAQDYQKRKEDIAISLEGFSHNGFNTFELRLNLVDLADRAANIYQKRKPEEKHLLLQILLSNAALKDQKVDWTLNNPFDKVVQYKKTKDWSG